MKVTPRLQEIVSNLESKRASGSQTDDSTLISAEGGSTDGMFQDVLGAELNKYQRVVSAEEIIADLDGTPTYRYNGISFEVPVTVSDGQTAPGATSETVRSIADKIDRIAPRYGVDPDLVKEVVRAESNFNPNAVSRVGAKGLMQLMDGTARMLNVDNSYDPDQNIAGGTKYLRDLLSRYDGNVKVALAAYNAGPSRISKLGIDTDKELDEKMEMLPEETQSYVSKIMNRYNG